MLNSRTIELDNHKAEWTARLNEMAAKHKNEMATEKEKMLQVMMFILLLFPFFFSFEICLYYNMYTRLFNHVVYN